MKKWFQNLGSRLQSFMYGRYGFDELSWFMSMSALVCIIVGLFAYPGFFSGLAMILYFLSIFRTYSRNLSKRQRERETYLRLTNPLRNWFSLQKRRFSERRTHRYFQCSQCRTALRVPRGKGKIKIHCPKCGAELVKKT